MSQRRTMRRTIKPAAGTSKVTPEDARRAARSDSRQRALADYIATFNGTFPCGRRVRPDGLNVQFKRDYDRQGNPVWSVRCRHCNQKHAREGMRRLRAGQREAQT